jgi:hypothetical protein
MGLFLFLYRWVIFAMGYFCGSIFKKVYLYRATMRHRSLRHAWRESVRISRVCFYFSDGLFLRINFQKSLFVPRNHATPKPATRMAGERSYFTGLFLFFN